MDTLPAELLLSVFEATDGLAAPVLSCVCARWSALVKKRKRALRQTVARLEYNTAHQRHVCTLKRRCASRYACLAMDRGRWNIVEWMLDCAGPFDAVNDADNYAYLVAAATGDLDRLKRIIHKIGFCSNIESVCSHAAEGGHLHVVKHLWRRMRSIRGIGGTCLPKAAAGGHLDVVKWLYSNGCAGLQCALLRAAYCGNMEVLLWFKGRGVEWNADMCCQAARGGQLDVLRQLRSDGCQWNPDTCASAAGEGHLGVIQWVVEKGCRLDDTRALVNAAYGGHSGIVEWLHNVSGRWDEGVCAGAALRGNVEALRWARANGCPWGEVTCTNAAKGGHLDILTWARANRCPWDRVACFGAALCHDHLSVLEWIRIDGFLNESYCSRAASMSNLPMLQWLRGEGCPWSAEVCETAASRGDLTMVRWAVSSGCPRNETASFYAAVGGHLTVLEWLLDNGCPWDDGLVTSWYKPLHVDQPDVFQWLVARGHLLSYSKK